MGLIETVFIGIQRFAMFVVYLFDGITGASAEMAGLVVVSLLAGGWLGLHRSERGRGRYDAKQAYERRNEYRRKGF